MSVLSGRYSNIDVEKKQLMHESLICILMRSFAHYCHFWPVSTRCVVFTSFSVIPAAIQTNITQLNCIDLSRWENDWILFRIRQRRKLVRKQSRNKFHLNCTNKNVEYFVSMESSRDWYYWGIRLNTESKKNKKQKCNFAKMEHFKTQI